MSSNEPLERCDNTDCFNQTQIRDFEVVDATTLIVYVGPRDCPYLVELSGIFCDLTFLPGNRVVFEPTLQRARREPNLSGGFGNTPGVSQARVCANDLSMGINNDPSTVIDDPLFPGDFRDNATENDLDGLDCRIRNVESLTDDEILDIYVDKRIAEPPPPFGTGQVSGGEAPPPPEPIGDDPATETPGSEAEPVASTQ